MQNSYFYVAKVTDNQDEEGLNRVKVTTQMNEQTVSYWLPYLTAAAGNGTGFTSLPDIDDQVLVLALGNDRDRQVVIGSFWNAQAVPPKTEENTDADLNGDGKNSLNFFKSRSGHMLIFDDTEGKEKLQLIASGGKTRIELDIENECINLETDKDISLSAKGNITIEAEKEIIFNAKKALDIECKDFAVKTNKEITIEAGKDITLKGSGIALN